MVIGSAQEGIPGRFQPLAVRGDDIRLANQQQITVAQVVFSNAMGAFHGTPPGLNGIVDLIGGGADHQVRQDAILDAGKLSQTRKQVVRLGFIRADP